MGTIYLTLNLRVHKLLPKTFTIRIVKSLTVLSAIYPNKASHRLTEN